MENIIRNIDDTYSVSSEGKFFKNGKEVKGSIGYNGYIYVCMYSKRYLLHRLVAQAFIPNPENKPCIDHLNTNRLDNRVENLRWATRKENANNPLSRQHNSDAKKGKHPSDETRKKMSEAMKGEKNPHYGKHLSEEHRKKLSKPLLQFSKDGEFIREWKSACEIERVLGYDQGNISACCLGKRKFAYKFFWKFKDIA